MVNLGSFTAFTSSRRRMGVLWGADFTIWGSALASSAMRIITSMKASSVSLLSVSVGSIISASWNRRGK